MSMTVWQMLSNTKNMAWLVGKFSTWFPWLPSRFPRVFRGLGTRKECPLLILGPGGVGKSTLGEFLAKSNAVTADRTDYDESIGVEVYPVKNRENTQVVVLPGQVFRRDATWQDVLADVAGSKYCGVILVCSYGYHTLGDISYKDHSAFEDGMSKNAFLESFLVTQRSAEESTFDEMCEAVRQCTERIWVLTVVTKLDLWTDQYDSALRHYKDGAYGQFFEKARGSKSTTDLRHEIAPVSLVLRSLETGRGEVLKERAKGFDQRAQQESVRRLKRMLDSLVDWGR